MSRAEASKYLETVHGIRRTASTLTKLAWKGGGPRFMKVGSAQVLYAQTDLDAWAAKLLSQPVEHTADFKSQIAK